VRDAGQSKACSEAKGGGNGKVLEYARWCQPDHERIVGQIGAEENLLTDDDGVETDTLKRTN
jgi:hypothetical protein